MTFLDIVIPSGNEEEFVEMACRLGLKGLVLYYPRAGNPRRGGLKQDSNFQIHIAAEKEAEFIIRQLEFVGKRTSATILSGQPLRHAAYRELSGKNVAAILPVGEIIRSGSRQLLLENIARHIRLCQKHEVDVIAATLAEDPYELRSEEDLKAFYSAMGMGTEKVRDAFLIVSELMEKKSG